MRCTASARRRTPASAEMSACKNSATPPPALIEANDLLTASAIAAMHQNTPVVLAQPLRDHAADAVGRAGNERRLSIRSCHGKTSLAHVVRIKVSQAGAAGRRSRTAWYGPFPTTHDRRHIRQCATSRPPAPEHPQYDGRTRLPDVRRRILPLLNINGPIFQRNRYTLAELLGAQLAQVFVTTQIRILRRNVKRRDLLPTRVDDLGGP